MAPSAAPRPPLLSVPTFLPFHCAAGACKAAQLHRLTCSCKRRSSTRGGRLARLTGLELFFKRFTFQHLLMYSVISVCLSLLVVHPLSALLACRGVRPSLPLSGQAVICYLAVKDLSTWRVGGNFMSCYGMVDILDIWIYYWSWRVVRKQVFNRRGPGGGVIVEVLGSYIMDEPV